MFWFYCSRSCVHLKVSIKHKLSAKMAVMLYTSVPIPEIVQRLFMDFGLRSHHCSNHCIPFQPHRTAVQFCTWLAPKWWIFPCLSEVVNFSDAQDQWNSAEVVNLFSKSVRKLCPSITPIETRLQQPSVSSHPDGALALIYRLKCMTLAMVYTI